MAEFVDVISMNLGDPSLTAHDGKQQRIDPGTYNFEIDKAVFDQSRKGNKTLRLTARVITEGPMKARTIMNSYVINDEEFSRRRMKAIVDATGVLLNENGGFSRESLIGLQFTADIILDEFEDLDSKTGTPVTKQITKWVGERQVEDNGEVQVSATPAKSAGPAVAGNAPRRQVAAAPVANGRPTPPRS